MSATVDARAALAADIGALTHDPEAFVLYAFPWGRGELAGCEGPDAWQRAVLREIGATLRGGGEGARAVREAVASGHGIGKSALVAWIMLWALSTCPDARGVVTANTEAQLKGKTWAELAKWHRLCLCGDWFDCTATALIAREPGHEKTWRMDMAPWSERNTEAFAGLHNQGRRVLLIFDEASAIPDIIWEVSEGALTDTDTEIIWCAFGNPTRNTGRFRECFGRFRHRWNTHQVDSRSAAMTNKAQIAEWITDYGEDSDFVKVRVRGVFPGAGERQFISGEVVEAARGRRLSEDMYAHAPRIMGVDVARHGDDSSVITRRQGLYCAPQLVYRDLGLTTLAGIVAREAEAWRPDRIFVDGVGVGAGVVDMLTDWGLPVTDAQSGAAALNPRKYRNRRAEMWAALREWLARGAIPDDAALAADLTGVEYGYTVGEALQLEKKSDLKKRGLASPDRADSLALTFYAPVCRASALSPSRAKTEYDVFGR